MTRPSIDIPHSPKLALRDAEDLLFPLFKNTFSDGLLNIFSLLIMGVPYNKTGYTMPTPSIDMTSEINVKQSKLLAIKTIGEFDFQDCNLMRKYG